MYIPQIKDFFKQTRMKKGYEKQILGHNLEKFNLIAKADLNMFSSAETLTQAKQNTTL